jgi:hypothetical protein
MTCPRYFKAMLSGCVAIDDRRWSAIVGNAISAVENEASERLTSFTSPPDPSRRVELRYARLLPTEIVVDSRDILGVEIALARALEERHEIELLAQDDIDSSRRARLSSAIESAIAKVRNRLNRGES